MSVEALVVPRFQGISRPGLTSRISTRQMLDTPREMYNFLLTEDGHLYMPEAPAAPLYDFSADGRIRNIFYVETPRGIVVQMTNGKIFHIGIDPADGSYDPDPISPTLLATMPAGEEQWNLWVNGTRAGYFLMGYAPRGSAGPATDGKTWKVAGTHTSPTVTDLTASVVSASWSTLYKGRRFWVKRGRQVYYTALNQYDQPHGVDDTFTISGDDAGNTAIDNPGFVRGMSAWEDVLVFFLGGSVWVLTGAGPDTWKLRQVQTIVGNSNAWTLVRNDEGVLTFGGTNLNDPGVYIFTGSSATKISERIDDWMRSTGQLSATMSAGRYILATSRSDPAERQFLLYDIGSRQWVAFDGWVYGTAAVYGSTLLINNDGVLYRHAKEIFPRCPGRGARVLLGYQDDENPAGMVRYLGVKLAGRKWGTGTPTVTITATTSEGSVVSGPHDVATDVFDGLVVPLNIRGSAIELLLEFTAADDDNELLIENLQVITSRKGEKVSRG